MGVDRAHVFDGAWNAVNNLEGRFGLALLSKQLLLYESPMRSVKEAKLDCVAPKGHD